MKNPVNIAKKSYNKILQIDDLTNKLNQILENQSFIKSEIDSIKNELSNLKDKTNSLETQNNYLKDLFTTEQKTNNLRFYAIYKHSGESTIETNKRFFENLPSPDPALRTFQLGNTKLLKKLIEICKKNNLVYFLQSGTLLGAVRHKGFVPWDDDTDVAMFRDDIKKLRDILKDDKNYRLALVYDYWVKSRQLRFRTTNPENPCFIDVYIYDYGNDDSDEAWQKWHKLKTEISDKIEHAIPEIIPEWRKKHFIDENTPLARKLKPLYEKYYDPLINKSIDRNNYTTVNWALDNFPIKWKRLFKKEFIFPTVKLTFENLKVEAPKEYDQYLKRQYGDIYQLPKDLATHYQHIDQSNIDTSTIKAFLAKE